MTTLRALGGDYLESLAQRDFTRIAAYLHPQVTFRALVPAGMREASDAAGTLMWLRRWFGDADEVTVLQQSSDESLNCLVLSYCFLMRTQDEWQVVAQHAFCSASDGQIKRMHLVCSGFQPVQGPESVGQTRQSPTTIPDSPVERSTPLLHADAVLDAPGEGCATLTPLIRARIRELESGQILDVRTDDPTARENLQAWCHLTGHALTVVGTSGTRGQRFLIRKK